MIKIKKLTYIILGLSTIAILYFVGSYLFSIGFDDYDYYDKELQQGVFTYIKDRECENCCVGSPSVCYCRSFTTETDKWLIGWYTIDYFTNPSCVNAGGNMILDSNNLAITAGGDLETAILTPKQILTGYDFKVRVDYNLPISTSFAINLNNISIFSKSYDTGSVFLELYSSRIEDKMEAFINGDSIAVINTSNGVMLKFMATGMNGNLPTFSVSNVKFRIPYSCKIDDKSVLVFDDFTTSFSQSDLSYSPLRYCLNNPPIIRSFEDGGLMQDERGEIFQKLVTGQTVNVDDGKTIRVPYITKYVEGQTLRCELNEAWNTNTQKCERIVEQETPTEIILACSQDSDCWLPTNCQEITASCISNVCNYSVETCQGIDTEIVVINEVIVYRDIIREIERENIVPIYIGNSEFTYTFDKNKKSFSIGDYVIATNTPDFTCTEEVDKRNDECYSVKINDITKHYNEEFSLNDYINVVCYAGRRVRDNLVYEDDNWISFCKFTITNDFLEISLVNNSKYCLLNSICKYNFTTKSNLYNFDNAGVYLDCERVTGLQRDLEITTHDIIINADSSIQNINLDTTEIGKVDCELTQFIRVNSDKQFIFKDNKKIKFSYLVDTTIPTTPVDPPEVLDCRDYKCEEGTYCKKVDDVWSCEIKECGFFCRIWEWIKNLLTGWW